MKFKLLLSLITACTIVSTTSFAAKATEGFRIFNQNTDPKSIITTNSPNACQGVSFPTPIAGNSNAVVKIDSSFTKYGDVCSTQYRDITGGVCLVSLVTHSGEIKMYTTAISGSDQDCVAVEGNTAVELQ